MESHLVVGHAGDKDSRQLFTVIDLERGGKGLGKGVRVKI